MGTTRNRQIEILFSGEPSFRARQAQEALFSPVFRSWDDVSSLPKSLRERLTDAIPWNRFVPVSVLGNARRDTWKALLQAEDGARIEAVLMRNSRGQFTVCVSTQVGCAMGCAFCATGRLGMTRNLAADEIVDQVRFFREYVTDNSLDGEVTNVVLMGMGEPLANYEEVREALLVLVGPMSVGPTRITVSTVGILPGLGRLLDDPEWPPVRLAISLHCADEERRRKMMPSTAPGFLDELARWSDAYTKAFPEKRRHLTLEYVMLSGVNDTDRDLRNLVKLAWRMGRVRVNLIPYNATGSGFVGSPFETISRFRDGLAREGVTVTVRKSLGGDIAAACGQLAGKTVRKEEGS
ncbi:MAG: 23S rRNA (adenine(2503)-C(2))-methyltransferase RlmN [Candidatus Moranbacteria bacterium]|nr:23S rRNA (adenine(2503)-C(2))-methyltransferase RlmN [Candidatus Moranbacteria bacterium]